MSLNGAIPQINRGGQAPGSRALFYSLREQAFLKDKTLQAGYGVLKAGTILAENLSNASTGGKGQLVPYVMDDSTKNNQIGVAYLVADYGTGETFVYVTMSDSYRFKVGDDLVLGRNNGGSFETHNGGAITAIDRTTHKHMAKITFTTQKASANFTTSNLACCWVESGTGDKLCVAKYILDRDVDTGTGEDAAGALSSVLIKNAILYKGVMEAQNYDSQAATDLGATADGLHVIV